MDFCANSTVLAADLPNIIINKRNKTASNNRVLDLRIGGVVSQYSVIFIFYVGAAESKVHLNINTK